MKTSNPKLRVLGLVVGGLLVAGGPVLAGEDVESYRLRRDFGPTHGHRAAEGQLVDVQVKVGGSTAPLYFRPGTWDKHYIQAFEGRNYSIVLHNNSAERVGVLVAVDGLNVVNGERSSLSRHEPMYILDPHQTTEIRGWRSSLRDVRRFVFVDEERSYAERTGQANSDMGWIRVHTFREQSQWLGWGQIVPRDHKREREAVPAPTPLRGEKAQEESSNDARAQRLDGGAAPESAPGTGWGDQRYDPVRRVQFEAVRNATDRIVLRYEYASGLRALGIRPTGLNRVWEREGGQLGFAKPPRW